MAADLKIRITAQDAASGVLGGIKGAVSGLGGAFTAPIKGAAGLVKGLGTLGMAAIGVKALGGAVAGLATGMVAGNAEFERYETQFGVLLKSTDKAKERLAMLAKFGASTPFELPELVRADKVLTAFGLHSETTAKKFGVSGEQILTTIGDVSAGTGANFEELSVTFGKFASGATGEAIARFQELGITTRDEMKSWGLQFSKAGELLTPVDKAFGILEKNVRKKFGGMMDAQSQTFEGMVSNLQDWMGATKRTLMAPVFDVLKVKLGDLLKWLNSPAVQGGIEKIGKLFAALAAGEFPKVLAGFKELTGIDLKPLVALFEPFIEKVNIVVGLVKDLARIIGDVFSGKLTKAEALSQGLDAIGKAIFAWIETTVKQLWAKVQLIGTVFTEWIQPMIPVLLAKLGEWAGALWTWIQAQVPPLVEKLKAWAQGFIAWIAPMIPPFLAQLPQIIDNFLTWIGQQAGPILQKLGNWAIQFLQWVIPMLPGFAVELAKILGAVAKFLIESIAVIGKHLVQWGLAFVTWLLPHLPGLMLELGKALGQIVVWILTEALPAIVRQLITWGRAFIEWVGKEVLPRLPGILAGILQSIVAFISGATGQVRSEAASIGRAIVEGVKNGIRSLAASLVATARGVVNNAINAAKNLLGISSPSKVFAEIGQNMTRGMALGMGQAAPQLVGASQSVAALAPRAMMASPAPMLAPAPALAGSGGRVVNIYVTGNTMLADDRATARRLMEILRPELDAQVRW